VWLRHIVHLTVFHMIVAGTLTSTLRDPARAPGSRR
jgi:hypothetical protein